MLKKVIQMLQFFNPGGYVRGQEQVKSSDNRDYRESKSFQVKQVKSALFLICKM